MDNKQLSARLMTIAIDVENASHMVRLAWMATEMLKDEEAQPLAAVLDLVALKLKDVSDRAVEDAGKVACYV